MDKDFEEAFGALNDEQKLAVTTTAGPLLVIAGPGTGKTQLLSARVANILKTTDTLPGNILCLTFTNKAAVNMKERIIKLVGAGGARVNAKTFHSFAAEIMNAYPDYFWNSADLSVAPESVQLDIIESIVKELPLDNPLALKFAGQYTLLRDIQRAINLAKDAGLTPAKLSSLIEVNLAYIDQIEPELVEILSPALSAKKLPDLQRRVGALPKQEIDEAVYPLLSLSSVITESLAVAIENDEGTNKTVNTGAWKKRWIVTEDGKKGMFKERRLNIWWGELADVYEKYREAIHQRGFYDYADMLVETISQLEKNPDILADVQERFNYVMIDEFQDTNPAQLRLAHLVADHHSANGQPNLMVVGDDDQSIFKFNGAELNNMLGFKHSYKTAEIIVLTKNYRSTQDVLDVAKKIIDQAGNRLINSDKSLNKDLVAADPPASGEIRATAYSSRELQLSAIARDIKQKHKAGTTTAVLARGHESLIKITAILQTLDVPVRYEQQSNVLDHPIVSQTDLIMRLLLAIGDGDKNSVDALIHQIIRHPLWGIAPVELWKLALANYSNGNWLKSMLDSSNANIKAIGKWFIWMAQNTAGQPLAIALEQILGLRPSGDYTSPIRDYFVDSKQTDTNQYFRGLSALQLLRSLVYEFAKADEPTLQDFVRFIKINKDNGKIVADESPFVTGQHAVQLLSVHKAKGLEFDNVFIIDALEDNWKPRSGNRKPPANLPLQPAGDDIDDYVRLMYVAATRAKSSLVISSYFQDHAGREVATSPIIQGAFDVKKVTDTKGLELTKVLEENLAWPELSGGLEKEMLKDKLQTYNLSVTHLLNFMDLTRGGPQYFKQRNILRLPEAKTTSLSYGTAMHAALETAQKLTNSSTFSLLEVQDAFSKALGAEQLAKAEYDRFEPKGRLVLARLFNELNYQLPVGSLPEQNLKDISLGRAVISGKLDRVDTGSQSLKIIDYKTGTPLNSLYTKDKNKAVKAYKHKLQLIFYALLAAEHPGFGHPKAIEGQMVYVEAETAKELAITYKPTPEDVSRLRQLIQAVWPKIINMELPNVSAYPQDINGILAFEQDLIDEAK